MNLFRSVSAKCFSLSQKIFMKKRWKYATQRRKFTPKSSLWAHQWRLCLSQTTGHEEKTAKVKIWILKSVSRAVLQKIKSRNQKRRLIRNFSLQSSNVIRHVTSPYSKWTISPLLDVSNAFLSLLFRVEILSRTLNLRAKKRFAESMLTKQSWQQGERVELTSSQIDRWVSH